MEEKNTTTEEVEEIVTMYYNTSTLVITAVLSGAGMYLVGHSDGVKKGFIRGLEDGKIRGYVQAISDVATMFRIAERK